MSAQVLKPCTSFGWAQRSPSAASAGPPAATTAAIIPSNAFMLFSPQTSAVVSTAKPSCAGFSSRSDCVVVLLFATPFGASAFEQNAVLGRKRQRDPLTLVEQLGRRTSDGQLSGGPLDNVLDEIAVEETLADGAGRAVRPAVRRTGGDVDIGGTDRHALLIAARHMRGPRVQHHPVGGLEDDGA